MRKRQQQPNSSYLVNVTRCHKGCDGSPASSNIKYYEGDLLKYWCEPGYRTNPQVPSNKGSYAICSGVDATWQFKSCKAAR